MIKKELYYKRNKNTNDSSHWMKFHMWKFVEKYLFRTSPNCFKHWRVFLLRLFGAKIGKGCYIASNVTITRPWEFEMGNISSIDEFCYIIPPVTIGDYCAISNNVHIIAGSHNIRSRGFELTTKRINIGSGCFIGCGCYIGPGIKIGDASVISAHISMQHSVPANKIVVPDVVKLISVDRLDQEEFEKYSFNYLD